MKLPQVLVDLSIKVVYFEGFFFYFVLFVLFLFFLKVDILPNGYLWSVTVFICMLLKVNNSKSVLVKEARNWRRHSRKAGGQQIHDSQTCK